MSMSFYLLNYLTLEWIWFELKPFQALAALLRWQPLTLLYHIGLLLCSVIDLISIWGCSIWSFSGCSLMWCLCLADGSCKVWLCNYKPWGLGRWCPHLPTTWRVERSSDCRGFSFLLVRCEAGAESGRAACSDTEAGALLSLKAFLCFTDAQLPFWA